MEEDDESGEPFLYTDGDDEPMGVLGLFKYTVYDKGGDALLVDTSPAPQQVSIMWMRDAVAMHRYLEVNVKVGAAGAQSGLEVALFRLNRQGCFVYWSMLSLYRGLGFSIKGGVPSKWVDQRWPRWEWCLQSMNVDGHLLKAKQDNRRAVAAHEPMRVFRWPSCSSVALIALLCLWAFGCRTMGGLNALWAGPPAETCCRA